MDDGRRRGRGDAGATSHLLSPADTKPALRHRAPVVKAARGRTVTALRYGLILMPTPTPAFAAAFALLVPTPDAAPTPALTPRPARAPSPWIAATLPSAVARPFATRLSARTALTVSPSLRPMPAAI